MAQRKALLDVGELAEYLGVSESTVYRMIRSKEIRAYKILGSWKFRIQDIEDYLESRTNLRLLR